VKSVLSYLGKSIKKADEASKAERNENLLSTIQAMSKPKIDYTVLLLNDKHCQLRVIDHNLQVTVENDRNPS
jgi:hypothetical protein